MEPFEFRRRVKPDTIAAFGAGVVAAWLIQYRLGLGGGTIFTVLIVGAVGGLWYKWRNVI